MDGVITKAVFSFSTKPPRRKPREGDTKTVKGKRYVRRQRRHEGAYMVKNGRPMFEWVEE